MNPNLAYMGPSCGRLLTRRAITIPPRQLQLAGTASSSVGIDWDPSIGFNDNRGRGSCRGGCNRGSTIGIGVPPGRSTAGSTIGGPPAFEEPQNCCWFEPPAGEEFEGSVGFPAVELVVASAESVRRRFDLGFPVSSESSVDACNGRLILRG